MLLSDMAEVPAGQQHVQVLVEGAKEPELEDAERNVENKRKKLMWWIRMVVYIILVLAGQTIATLLGRLYYDKGGNSKWLATLVNLAGFPVCIPFLFFSPPETDAESNSVIQPKQPSILIIASVYLDLGLLLTAVTMMYSTGLLYLPVSTYSLICASQLAFNALFAFFLNSQKFTPCIVNSLVLLTISSALLVFQPDSSYLSRESKAKYALGFLVTVGASAGYSLMLSLTQLTFCKVIKKETYRAVLEMAIYQSTVATAGAVVGLYASGEWKTISTEMHEFKLGEVSYMMTLAWIALCWQVFSIGALCLIYEVSSLFSNSISTLGLPLIPIFAVVFFHDKMDGIKAISMILAIWGFASYLYQQYLDDVQSKIAKTPGNVSVVESPTAENITTYV